ncbi:Ion transport protein-domain-containing protein [Rhypophila decipiens]|uniref:Calcium-channel protein CCH1 n=1 Tax=Rhypophila decipiens TaxID=261697 RepID=A0AAN7B6M7_9PEZI|nr:Ion transport protein-domain-containing protein [Rhypophila decipiens]
MADHYYNNNNNNSSSDRRTSAPPSSIPLRDLQRSPDDQAASYGGRGRDDAPSFGATYSPGDARDPSPGAIPMSANLPGFSTYWEHPYPAPLDDRSGRSSPIDYAAVQYALPPDIGGPSPPLQQQQHLQPQASALPMYMPPSVESYQTPQPYYEGNGADTDSLESDSVPLKRAARPIGGLEPPAGEAAGRDSFQTVSDVGNGPSQRPNTQMLGFDLEPGFASDRQRRSYGNTLAPGDRRRSRSPTTAGALSRAGSIMRAMSQRVVMISGEADAIEQQARRQRSRSPSVDVQRSRRPTLIDTTYPSQVFPSSTEKGPEPQPTAVEEPPPFKLRPRGGGRINPLKGKSLGIFGPENPLRKWLCDLLVNPVIEPLILILIILQAVLLAVEAAPDVFQEGNQRPERWGSTRIDWAIFGLFVVFSFELVAKIIVSGFIINAPEYEAANSKRRIREKMAEQYRAIFQPQRHRSVRQPRQEEFVPNPFARSFTMMQGQTLPHTVEEQQRLHLARRAFLRHGFNRLDFVAVVAFWVSFVVGISGLESKHHLYVFRMLSCLRIIRLLALTKGNLIILRSLKKATPLLVRVSFLMGFFWLLFAIIGVQSFKSSLSRQCTWVNPEDPTNFEAAYTPDFSFCGGYINTTNGNKTEPWVFTTKKGNLSSEFLAPGGQRAKGFICPRGSICLQQENPYNGTVHFDDIGHSLELVFVIMSANTFSDLMYYTVSSDFLPAALFFGAGIIIMMLWMTNLLIAVITSSFQVIREESKASAFTADEPPLMGTLAEEPLRRRSSAQRIYRKVSWLWVVAIAYGLLCQAFRTAYMSERQERFIDTSEMVVTIMLDVEIVIRFIMDFRRFHKKKRNLVDLFLAVATSIILIPPIRNSGQLYNWLTVFQILRVYRVVLAIPMTRKLIQLVLGNVTGIGNLMLFVFLMTFLMAIFAAQLFRGQIPQQDHEGEDYRITFNTIYNSFLGMYQILSSENWTEILYSVTAHNTELHRAWIGAIFLIGWFILSYFILVNMFIAVIQENFDVGEDVKRLEQVKAFLQRKELGGSSSNLALSKVFALGRSNRHKDPLDYGPGVMEMLLKEAVVREFLDESMDPLQDTSEGAQSPPEQAPSGAVKPGLLSHIWGKIGSIFKNGEPNPFYSNYRFETKNETLDPRQMAREAVTATNARRKAQREYLIRHPNYNNSLFIFKPRNPLRRLCQQIVGPGRGSERFDGIPPNKYAWYTFSGLIYAAIVAMVVLACVTTPLYQKEYFDRTIDKKTFGSIDWFVWADLAFAVVFTLEALIKIVADGFLWTPNAYFRSTWGIIDAVVLITLWINVITLITKDGAVSRAVGAFKALRALRLLNVSDSARETFHSLLIVGGPKIISAAFVSISLLIPFAVYGLNLFNGKLFFCNDQSGAVGVLQDCFGEYNSTPYSNDWPILAPRAVSNPYFNFDDFGSSLFILFQIVSQEGWVDVSFAVQAITGKGLQPQNSPPFSGQGNALFFVVFNLLATVFVLTLFISVFMRNYTEQTGVAFLTAEQRSWLELRKLLRQISPSRSSYDETKNKWKIWCHKRAIEKRGKWYVAITSVLVCHLVLLLAEFYTEPPWWTRTRDILFLIFTVIYITNIIVRIVGLGWNRFRKSSWDVFSLVAVIGTLATSILFLINTTVDTYNQLHKFFLVAIVLLLIPRNDALDQLFKTAAASLTTIGSLLATWLVFFLVFAIALTQAFSLTRFGAEEDANINLRTVPNALILLFRFSCGEGWNQVMEDFAKIQPPFCVEGPSFFDSDCGGTAWARVLFVAWNIISMYLFVNLFVSLIYESFSYVYQRTSGLAVVDRDEIRRFKEAWRSVDPTGTGFITKEQFPRLLGELSGVFEMRIYAQEDSVRSILDDVRGGNDTASIRHASMINSSQYQSEIPDLKKLNARINQINVAEVRRRRRRFNIFFEEVMVSADPERGISFTTVLMILAHYNIISDSKSLRLEEFLRRRARLQRVEDEVRRRVVLGFFDMLYYSRKFKRHMEIKRSARMTAIPQLDVPEILVDNDEDRNRRDGGAGATSGPLSPAFLSADDAHAHHHRSWSNISADLSSYDTSYGHPLAGPRASGPSSPGHRGQPSAFSFELSEIPPDYDAANDDDDGTGGGAAGPGHRASAVSPAQVREMLDDSVWMASIRRSATMNRRPPDLGWGGGGPGGY